MTTQLVINKHGTQLSCSDNRFLVKNADESQTVAVSKVSSIMLHQATKLTYEVIKTAVDNDIDIVFVDRKGNTIARIWSNKFGSVATVRKNQLLFSQHEQSALNFAKKVIAEKINNQCTLLSLLGMLALPENEKQLAAVLQK